MNKPHAKTFNCPNCGSNVKIQVQGQSLTVVCQSCSSIIDTSDENYILLKKVQNIQSRKQYIPLGTRGTLNGVLWEVTGYMERKDGFFMWSEYLLFNPMKGYRFLVEYKGHWNLFKSIKEKPISKLGKEIFHSGNAYKLYNKGKAEVSFVMGEFYWKVRIGDTVKMTDYICPPYSMSAELDGSEIVWSFGEYIEPDLIKKSFGITELPPLIGVGPAQPSKFAKSPNLVYAALFFVIIIFLQVLFGFSAKKKQLLNDTFVYTKDSKEKVKVTPSFEIIKSETNLELCFTAPSVNNNWVELSVTLVNDNTGETVEHETGIEFYHGVESGEKWSEGSHDRTILIPSLPAGKYHVNFEASGPLVPNNNPPSPDVPVQTPVDVSDFSINLRIRNDVLIWSNFLWSIFLLSISPIILALRKNSFEAKRWEDSDYSPYQGS